jgi:hypothetical protein
MKIANVMPVEFVSSVLLHQRGDAFVFPAHGSKIKPKVQSPKFKVTRTFKGSANDSPSPRRRGPG